MTDGLVTLVDEVNLKGFTFGKEGFGLGADGAEGRRHQTGYSQQCLHLSGF